jgi:hypothetical protein
MMLWPRSFHGPLSWLARYPYVATEVLCSEIWSIVEGCLQDDGKLLKPFWETVLNRSSEDMKTQVAMAVHFTKINSVFLSKKPHEVHPSSPFPMFPDHPWCSDVGVHPSATRRLGTPTDAPGV